MLWQYDMAVLPHSLLLLASTQNVLQAAFHPLCNHARLGRAPAMREADDRCVNTDNITL